MFVLSLCDGRFFNGRPGAMPLVPYLPFEVVVKWVLFVFEACLSYVDCLKKMFVVFVNDSLYNLNDCKEVFARATFVQENEDKLRVLRYCVCLLS